MGLSRAPTNILRAAHQVRLNTSGGNVCQVVCMALQGFQSTNPGSIVCYKSGLQRRFIAHELPILVYRKRPPCDVGAYGGGRGTAERRSGAGVRATLFRRCHPCAARAAADGIQAMLAVGPGTSGSSLVESLPPVVKPSTVRCLGPVDAGVVAALVRRLSDEVWRREDRCKENAYFCFHHTRHVVFRFIRDSRDPRRFYSRPSWLVWRPWLAPLNGPRCGGLRVRGTGLSQGDVGPASKRGDGSTCTSTVAGPTRSSTRSMSRCKPVPRRC